MKLCRRAMMGIFATLAAPRLARAEVLDPAFVESVFVPPTGLGGTTGIAWAPDGSERLFVMRQIGHVRIVDRGALRTAAFAVMDPVISDSECGLLGLAFDPSFLDNGYVYFFVTVSTTEQQIIRMVADGNVGRDKTVIVPGLPTRGENHDGGAVGFGPDGKLYWAIGDLGDGTGAGDDLTSLASKVGRVNPDGSVPTDNPFFDGPGPNEDRIWARGFRNPFSFTWQPGNERLWVDVAGAQYEQVFTPRAGDHAGWGEYQNDQPSGFLSPVIAYRTHGADARNLIANGSRRASGVATYTTSIPHRFRLGTKLTITGSSDPSFDRTGFVSEVPSASELSMLQDGPDATAGGGLASSLEFGAAVTGGAFWDSSAVPTDYRGDFFFADFISGKISRANLRDPSESEPVVLGVDYFVQADRPIDLDVGLDGDLYYGTFGGGVNRLSYIASSQGIVLSKLHLRLAEGGQGVLGVRLAMPPPGPVAVEVAQVSGGAGVSVLASSSFEFDAQSWATPQLLRIAAAQDEDGEDEEAVLAATSLGLSTERFLVRVTDDDEVSQVGGAGGAAGAGGAVDAGGTVGGERAAPSEAGAAAGGAASSGTSAGGEDPSGEGEGGQGEGEGGVAGNMGVARGGTGAGEGSGCSCRTARLQGVASGGAPLVALLGMLLVRRSRRVGR